MPSNIQNEYNALAHMLEMKLVLADFAPGQSGNIKKIINFLQSDDDGEPLSKDGGDFVIPASYNRPKARIFMLHGILSSAKGMVGSDIVNYVLDNPDIEFHFLNGTNKKKMVELLSEEGIKELGVTKDDVGFTWDQSAVDLLVQKLADYNDDVPNVLFGFSQGGFVISNLIDKADTKIDYTFLHSSALILRHESKEKLSKEQKELLKSRSVDTLISRDDKFLKSPFALAAFPVHYWKSFKLRLKGVKTKTIISNGFGHGINKKSLKIFDKRMRKALKL